MPFELAYRPLGEVLWLRMTRKYILASQRRCRAFKREIHGVAISRRLSRFGMKWKNTNLNCEYF